VHTLRRGTSHEAALLVRAILASRDDQAHTAHRIANQADRDQLPDRVQDFTNRRDRAVQTCYTAYRSRRHPHPKHDRLQALQRIRDRERERSQDYGLEL
jgi:hypothetical protein